MTLSEFQFIYWWEWAHRFLGRMIGVAYAVPFAFFLWRGMIPRGQAGRFVALFLLGGLQGAVGWWMVASGLEARVDVAPYRLALHLTLACVIFAGLVWTAASLGAGTPRRPETRRIRLGAGILVALVFVQIFLGALVAGNDAGLVYNTWPDMNGHVLPPEAFGLRPFWHNFFEDHAAVQFMHRAGAYLVLVAALWHALAVTVDSLSGRIRAGAWTVLGLLVAQAAIGIATLLFSVPLDLALAHQAMAVVVLAAAVLHLRGVYHPA
jgi:cytochrome c oxidase assembly protein subunit 15